MADTTKEKILEIAPELSSMPEALFTTFITLAANQITYDVWGVNEQLAQSYFCAHFLTEINDVSGGDGASGSGSGSSSGAVTREKVDQIERQYANLTSAWKDSNRFDTTMYGRTFNTLRKTCIMHFNVFIP